MPAESAALTVRRRKTQIAMLGPARAIAMGRRPLRMSTIATSAAITGLTIAAPRLKGVIPAPMAPRSSMKVLDAPGSTSTMARLCR